MTSHGTAEAMQWNLIISVLQKGVSVTDTGEKLPLAVLLPDCD